MTRATKDVKLALSLRIDRSQVAWLRQIMIDRELNYGRHLMRDFSAQALKDVPGQPVILDLGAGSGTDLDLARQSCSQGKYHGIEFYPPNIQALTAKKIQTHQLNLETEKLPFANQSVDLVMANQVLEHTKEVFWIFHEVSRVLKVGGHFLIGVPNLASFHNRCLLAIGKQPTAIQTASAHVRGFTKHDTLRFLRKCFPDGYKLTAFGGSNFYPLPPLLAKPLAATWSNGSVSIFMLLQKTKDYQASFIEYPKVEKLETNYFLGPEAIQ